MGARGKRSGRRARWIDRVFWFGVAALGVWLAIPRVAAPIVSANGYRRVESLAAEIRAAADEFDLDPDFLAGIAMAESSGRIDAVSSVGALGLFQLMLPTARERARLLGLREPERDDLLRDAALNARLAAAYVRWLSDRYAEDAEQVLIAYNAGPGRLDGWIREHGSYDAWRAARANESAVLAYALKVRRYRDRFEERGVISPRLDHPPAPSAALTTSLPIHGPPPPPVSDRPAPRAP